MNAVLKSNTVLEENCERKSCDNRDSVVNYWYKKVSDSKFRLTLTALEDVLSESVQLCLSFQTRNLKVMGGQRFARAKIKKIHSLNLKDERNVKWNDRVREVMRTSSADSRNTAEINPYP